MNKGRRISLVVVLFILVSAVQAFAENKFQAGKAAFERGDYLAAISALKDAVQDEKQNLEAYLLLSKAYLKADSVEQASVTLFQAREIAPSSPAIYELLGDVYTKQHVYAMAADQYKKAADLDSTKPAMYLKLADAYKRNRQYTEAAQAYRAVLRLDTANRSALIQLGDIYMRTKPKRFAEALPIFEALSLLFPDTLLIQVRYALCLYGTGNCDKFIPVGEKVTKVDPSQTELQTMLADCYNKTGKIDEAIRAYRNVNLESLSIEKLISLAKAYKAKTIFDTAAIVYQLALKKDSTRCDIPYEFGTIYMQLHRWNDAVRMFDRKIACDTSAGYQFASHYNAAVSMLQTKEYDGALAHIKKSISFKPEYVQAWVTLAETYDLLKQEAEEISAYKKVIELGIAGNADEEEGKYNKQLAEAYRMIGVRLLIGATKDTDLKTNKSKYAASADYLKKALQLNPKDCEALLWAAQAYQNSNNKDDAKKYYHKVLDNCPNSKQATDAAKGLKVLGE
ncbi:MAG: tetratricopeptide repeat protein [Ignavibacteria bacterium]|nr:MAG: tetratricopeptide repeat protein [Ignavibacteria bacterium]